MFTYITSNPNKKKLIKSFLEPEEIEFRTKELDLVEIQSSSGREVAIAKA